LCFGFVFLKTDLEGARDFSFLGLLLCVQMAAAALIFSTMSSTSCCWKARCSSVVLPRSACLQSSSYGFHCVRFPQSQIHLLKARRRPALVCAARTGRRQGSSSSKIKVGNVFTSFFFCSLSLSLRSQKHMLFQTCVLKEEFAT
jgi:hypothetical protein